MDQIKIGSFIASLRKEKNMTQLDLANKLGISDRTISKWENGRGLPDLSLMKPLCSELSISINELLSGEKITEDEVCNKTDENVINTLNYTKNKIKHTKIIFFLTLFGVISILAILVICFSVDVGRMRDNKPVVFSTWGFDYAPPVDLKQEKLEYAIKDYLISIGDTEQKDDKNVKTFVAFKTYLIEEKSNEYSVYAWVLQEQCYLEINDIMNYSSFSAPYKFTLQKNESYDAYSVVDSNHPRDGSYYSEDIKTIFPDYVIKEMNLAHKDGTIERLQLQIEDQVQLYFHQEYYPFVY